VKEVLNEYVTVSSPYVLKNQKLGEEILVRATDHAGNTTVSSIHPAPDNSGSNNKLIWGIILLLTVLAFVARVYEKKRNK